MNFRVRKILVVEDETELREAIASALSSSGYEVLQAENGLEALNLLLDENLTPDLIVSDVMMPKMTGPALAKKMKEAGRSEKILFLSGYVDDFLSMNKEALGQHEFLEKPFKLVTLLERIKAMAS